MSVRLLPELLTSRPVWGAWIEITVSVLAAWAFASRPVWGAWIEIPPKRIFRQQTRRRAPYGARGLKSEMVLLTPEI